MNDALKRTLRTLVAALASAAIFALGPIVNVCRTVDPGSCLKTFGGFPDSFFQLAFPAVGTAVITLLGNLTEDKTNTSLLGPK